MPLIGVKFSGHSVLSSIDRCTSLEIHSLKSLQVLNVEVTTTKMKNAKKTHKRSQETKTQTLKCALLPSFYRKRALPLHSMLSLMCAAPTSPIYSLQCLCTQITARVFFSSLLRFLFRSFSHLFPFFTCTTSRHRLWWRFPHGACMPFYYYMVANRTYICTYKSNSIVFLCFDFDFDFDFRHLWI